MVISRSAKVFSLRLEMLGILRGSDKRFTAEMNFDSFFSLKGNLALLEMPQYF